MEDADRWAPCTAGESDLMRRRAVEERVSGCMGDASTQPRCNLHELASLSLLLVPPFSPRVRAERCCAVVEVRPAGRRRRRRGDADEEVVRVGVLGLWPTCLSSFLYVFSSFFYY